MFTLQPPSIRNTDVFTRLPDRFRAPAVTAWSAANRGGAAIDSFLEAPVFDGAGNLYVGDIPFGRIFRIDPAGDWTLVVQYDGEPNGMKFASGNEIMIADYKNGIMVLDIAEGRVRPHLPRRNTERFKGPNDLIFDSRGNLYFTDQGQTGLHDPAGCVYRLGPDGRLDRLLSNVPSPNGVALSPDERVLYVAVTRGNCVWRVPLMDDGGTAKVGQFFTSRGPSGPDGLAVDAAGKLIVANPGLGVAWVLDAMARPVEVLRSVAGTSLTNLAFGGPGRRVAHFKEKPLAITYGASGVGSSGHFAAELFASQAGIRLTNIPYKGAAPVVADLVAGHVDASFATLGSVLPQVKASKLSALAVASPKRSEQLPSVATFGEGGLGNYSADASYGVLAPASLPDAQVALLERQVRAFVTSPAGAEKLRALGMEPQAVCGTDFARQIARDVDIFKKIARDIDLKVA